MSAKMVSRNQVQERPDRVSTLFRSVASGPRRLPSQTRARAPRRAGLGSQRSAAMSADRKSVVEGKSGSVRVGLGGRRTLNKNNNCSPPHRYTKVRTKHTKNQ